MSKGLMAGVGALILGMAGIASANQGQGFSNTDDLAREVGGISDLLGIFIFVAYAMVGGYVIIGELSNARETGRWGRVGVAIAAVLVVGFTLWGVMSRAGQQPDRIIQKIQAR